MRRHCPVPGARFGFVTNKRDNVSSTPVQPSPAHRTHLIWHGIPTALGATSDFRVSVLGAHASHPRTSNIGRLVHLLPSAIHLVLRQHDAVYTSSCYPTSHASSASSRRFRSHSRRIHVVGCSSRSSCKSGIGDLSTWRCSLIRRLSRGIPRPDVINLANSLPQL